MVAPPLIVHYVENQLKDDDFSFKPEEKLLFTITKCIYIY